jgi:peptidyl-dipeptidase Dcp
MARHWNPIMMNAVLFGRIALLHDNRATLGLTGEQMRLLERTYTRFHRAGAGLDEAAKKRMAEINERLAHLGTAFSHHLLGDEQDWFMELGEADRDGLSDSFVAAAKAAAEERGMAGKAIMTLSRSFVEPFLKSSGRRDLREKVFKAFTARGDNGNANDNNATIVEILALREESAKLLGFPTFAAYRLEDSMAKTPQAVRGLLERVWKPARARALADRDALQALVAEEGGNFALAPWDWRYYAEKLRQVRANFDDAAIKPYLVARPHDRGRLRLRHPPVRRQLCPSARISRSGIRTCGSGKSRTRRAAQGAVLWRLLRPASKRSGAWMTSLRDQQKLDGEVAPLVLNVCNFSKGADGEPSLLSPDDARTLFHEFGHGLHGMLSDVTYPSLSGTSRVHRFRRAALAALRALAGAAAGAAAIRPALPDRRAAAGRPA